MTNVPPLPKIALVRSGISQAALAAELHVDVSAVSRVVHGRSRSKRIEARVATATQTMPAELWPQWYGTEAQKRRPRRRHMPLDAALKHLESLTASRDGEDA